MRLMRIEKVLEQIKANQERVRWLPRMKKDGTTFDVPMAKLGNETYAWRAGKRLAVYKQNFLQGMPDSSVLFITLVTPYGSTYYGCRDSWLVTSKALGPFCKALKKLGAIEYFAGLEATSEGCCHCHLLARWDKPLQSSVRNDKHYLSEKALVQSICKKWISAWANVSELPLNNNAVSIQVCPNQYEAENAFDYATAHLGFQSNITHVINRVSNNKGDSTDIEKLFTNYWGTKWRIKLYRASRGLRKGKVSCVN